MKSPETSFADKKIKTINSTSQSCANFHHALNPFNPVRISTTHSTPSSKICRSASNHSISPHPFQYFSNYSWHPRFAHFAVSPCCSRQQQLTSIATVLSHLRLSTPICHWQCSEDETDAAQASIALDHGLVLENGETERAQGKWREGEVKT